MSKSKKNNATAETPPVCASPCAASIASLLEDHRASLSNDFKTAFSSLESKLSEIQECVIDHGQRIDSLELTTESQDQRLQKLEEKYANLSERHAKLTAKSVDLEARSRRNNIRVTGLPEGIEGQQQPVGFFSRLLAEVMGTDDHGANILQSPPALDRAHRVLAGRHPGGGPRPRVVSIRLHRFQTKDLIVREARKRRGQLVYHGTPIQIFEDYPQEIVEQRAEYRGAMAKLYQVQV